KAWDTQILLSVRNDRGWVGKEMSKSVLHYEEAFQSPELNQMFFSILAQGTPEFAANLAQAKYESIDFLNAFLPSSGDIPPVQVYLLGQSNETLVFKAKLPIKGLG